MRRKLIFGAFLIATTFGCVDRVFFDIKIPETYGISISGFISDQQGPYQVSVFQTFDIESKDNPRIGVTAHVVLSDAEGNSEILKQTNSGVYETSIDGIQGKIGGVYKVKVELDDGRVYESTPDTLPGGGSMDSLYYKVVGLPTVNGITYEFEIYGRTSTEADLSKVHFMWRNRTTFKSKTAPEAEAGPPPKNCYRIPEEGRCNFVHPCSGIKNIGSDFEPFLVRIGPCTCCFCWYDTYNSQVLLNDKIPLLNGRFSEIKLDRVPLNGWYMMYKVRIEGSIQSLSPQAYRFWKAVRDQYSAVSNIFQPITGRIPGNFVQIDGSNSPALGLFYATSASSKYFYIQREDVNEDFISDINFAAGATPCFNLYPNATTVQPAFWVE